MTWCARDVLWNRYAELDLLVAAAKVREEFFEFGPGGQSALRFAARSCRRNPTKCTTAKTMVGCRARSYPKLLSQGSIATT
jgi:hypothetical protein